MGNVLDGSEVIGDYTTRLNYYSLDEAINAALNGLITLNTSEEGQ